MSMSCMLQPPVPSLPPMAPASGSADHAVSGARSGRQVLPLAAAGFWTRLAGHGDDDSCPRDPGTPRWRIRARVSARAVPMEWLWWLESGVGAPGSRGRGQSALNAANFIPTHPRPSITMPQGCCVPSERPGRPLPPSAPPSDPAESASQRKGQLAGLAHAVSRARTGSRGAPGPSRRPAGSRRPTRGA